MKLRQTDQTTSTSAPETRHKISGQQHAYRHKLQNTNLHLEELLVNRGSKEYRKLKGELTFYQGAEKENLPFLWPKTQITIYYQRKKTLILERIQILECKI